MCMVVDIAVASLIRGFVLVPELVTLRAAGGLSSAVHSATQKLLIARSEQGAGWW